MRNGSRANSAKPPNNIKELSLYRERAVAYLTTASATAMCYFSQPAIASQQKTDKSPLSLADSAIDALLCEKISVHYPEHAILAEESGAQAGQEASSDYLWLIDPIDGTKSFIAGNPLFGSTLALSHQGKPLLGCLALPALGLIYSGGTDLDAQEHNEQRALSPSKVLKLKQAYLCLNEAELFHQHYPNLAACLEASARYLRYSHDCFTYTQLLIGKVDAVIEFDLQPWDFMPLAALLPSAGACISDWQGNALTLQSSGSVLASCGPELHEQLLDILSRL